MSRFVSPVNSLSTRKKWPTPEKPNSFSFAANHSYNPSSESAVGELKPGDYLRRYLYDKERLGPKWRYHNCENLTYEENSLGHRSHLELENLKGDWGLAVGCSNTEGIANYYDDMYHQKLATKLGMPVYNAGIGGGSNDMAFHNALMIILFMKINPPKCLIFQVTDPARFLYMHTVNNHCISAVGSWSNDKVHQDIMLANESMNLPTTRLNILLLQLSLLCDRFGIKFVPLDCFGSLNLSEMCEGNHLGISKQTHYSLPKSYVIEKTQFFKRLHRASELCTNNIDRYNFFSARDLDHAGAGKNEEVSVFLANVINSMEYPS